MLKPPVENRLEKIESEIVDTRTTLERHDNELRKRSHGAAGSWYPAGAVLAGLLSWEQTHSLVWAIFDGFLSWLYVAFRFLQHLLV